MSRLEFGDQVTAATADDDGEQPPAHRRFLSAIPHGTVRVAQDGGVVVGPSHPGEGFPASWRASGKAEGEPLTVIPPSGRRGAESLYDDRLAAPEFVAGLRTPAAEREGDLLPFPLEEAVSRRVRTSGPNGSLGGVAYPVERGGESVTYQGGAVCAGCAVPTVCTGCIVCVAEEILRSLPSARRPAITEVFDGFAESEV